MPLEQRSLGGDGLERKARSELSVRERSADERQTRRGANCDAASVCAPSLELIALRAGSTRTCLRFQPDRGNLAVRDDRGGRRKPIGARIEAPALSR